MTRCSFRSWLHRLGMAMLALVLIYPATVFAAADDIREIIKQEARKTAVPVSLALAVAQVESGLRPDHRGENGARGLFQILPETAEDMGTDPRDLWRPRANARVGLEILERLLDRTDGRWQAALEAYQTRHGDTAAEHARYVTDVLGWERRFAERLALTDAIDPRRREVLMGRDDWAGEAHEHPRTEPADQDHAENGHDAWNEENHTEPEHAIEPEMADLPPYLQDEDIVDPMLDDDTDVPVGVRIFRGHSGDEIEITIYQESDDHDDGPKSWRRPPPPWPPVSAGPRYRDWTPPRPRGPRWKHRAPAPRFQSGRVRGPRWSPRRAKRLKRLARRMARRLNR